MHFGKQILTDCLTFAVIAMAGALFSFSGAGGTVALTGKVVCLLSIVSMALTLVVKRNSGTRL